MVTGTQVVAAHVFVHVLRHVGRKNPAGLKLLLYCQPVQSSYAWLCAGGAAESTLGKVAGLCKSWRTALWLFWAHTALTVLFHTVCFMAADSRDWRAAALTAPPNSISIIVSCLCLSTCSLIPSKKGRSCGSENICKRVRDEAGSIRHCEDSESALQP